MESFMFLPTNKRSACCRYLAKWVSKWIKSPKEHQKHLRLCKKRVCVFALFYFKNSRISD